MLNSTQKDELVVARARPTVPLFHNQWSISWRNAVQDQLSEYHRGQL